MLRVSKIVELVSQDKYYLTCRYLLLLSIRSPDFFDDNNVDVGEIPKQSENENLEIQVADPIPSKKKQKRNPLKSPTEMPLLPERVESSNVKSSDAFDEEDYKVLYQRYLIPRVREKAEIPGGMTLRRQTKARVIDTPTPGYKKLKQKINELLKKNHREEIYHILCGLRNWEMNPLRTEVWREVDQTDGDDVKEYLDMTNDGEDHCIDVDSFTVEVRLVNVKEEQVSNNVKSSLTVSTDDMKEQQDNLEEHNGLVSEPEPEHEKEKTKKKSDNMSDSEAAADSTKKPTGKKATKDPNAPTKVCHQVCTI
jgi:hypothetical protein